MELIYDIEEKDLEECAELFVKTFNEEPWNEKWTVKKAGKRLSDVYNSPEFKGFVYSENEKIYGAILGNKEQWYDGEHFYIKEFFIDSNIQGKGIGKKLLLHLEKCLEKEGVSLIHFWTLKGDIAEKFYRKMGYEIPEELILMNKSFKL